jgi:flavodoxin
MKSLVIYTSTSGNTQKIAEAIATSASARGPVELMTTDQAAAAFPDADLVFIGGPTERHGMTEPMAQFLDHVLPSSLQDIATAAFDTRLRWPRLLSGSAADDIAKRLRAVGARVVAAPESFIVSSKPQLEPGEIERAGAWAAQVSAKVGA